MEYIYIHIYIDGILPEWNMNDISTWSIFDSPHKNYLFAGLLAIVHV